MMTRFYFAFNFIYETDNIPDHRSRQFGGSPCMINFRKLKTKSCIKCANTRYSYCKGPSSIHFA